MGASNIATGATVHALRYPLGALQGVAGAACRPRKRRGVHRGLRRRDRPVDRMVGVLEMVWRSGRCYHEGYTELQVTVYWRHGDMCSGTGVCMAGVQGIRGGTGEPYSGDNEGSHGGTGVSP